MRIPSVALFLRDSRESLLRFFWVILVAVVGTTAAVILAEPPSDSDDLPAKIILAAGVGIPLLIAITLVAERAALSPGRKQLVLLFGVLLTVLYFFTVLPPVLENAPVAYLIRTAVLLIALHLLVAVAPFLVWRETSSFWEFNKILLFQLIISGVCTFILWAGLSVAMAAVKQLFNVHIDGWRYAQLFFILAGVFNTWFFLSGVPRDVARLEPAPLFPKVLRILVQYILIPLVFVYLFILYSYSGKIIIEWDWPKGWVSYLVLGFSAAGILAFLLTRPLAERADNVFVRLFSRGFFPALLPMTVLLFLAASRRISEYGITERRYYVLVLAFWLAGIVVYYIFSRRKNLKVIPLSLCLAALLTTIGPWSATSVASQSQRGRLEEILLHNGVLVDGKIVRSSGVPFTDAKEISSILRHLTTITGYEPLQPWFAGSLDTLGGATGDNRARGMAELMGIQYVEEWESSTWSPRHYNVSTKTALNIEGYDLFLPLDLVSSVSADITCNVGSEQWSVQLHPVRQEITIIRPSAPPDSLVFQLSEFAKELAHDYPDPARSNSIEPGRLSLEGSGRTMKAKLAFNHVQCGNEADSTRFDSGDGIVFLRLK